MIAPRDGEDHRNDDLGDVPPPPADGYYGDPYDDVPLLTDEDAPYDPYDDVPPSSYTDEATPPPPADEAAPLRNSQPCTASELREFDADLYKSCLEAGIIRARTNPSDLLPETVREDGTDISLEAHLRQTPQGALPEPDATDVDVANAVAELFGEDRVRFYQPQGTTHGGSWQVYTDHGWKTVTAEWMGRLIVELIHPARDYTPPRRKRMVTKTEKRPADKPAKAKDGAPKMPPPDVPQRIRPVTLTKLTRERVAHLEDCGLIEVDVKSRRIVVRGTAIAVVGTYRPATDWTGRASTVENVMSALRGRLADRRELDAPADTDDWTINIGGVLLDVSQESLVSADGELELHVEPVRRHHLVSKSTSARWDEELLAKSPEERCPEWLKFAEAVNCKRDEEGKWHNRPEHEAVFQKLAGMALVPAAYRHRAGVFYGDHGNNGKSLAADTLLAVMGDYGATVSTQYISKGANEPHPAGLVKLVGARLAVMHEMHADEWHPTRTKRFVSDARIEARGMGKDPADYARTHNLFVTANNLPSVTGDSGFWKRLVLLPFEARWYGADDDKDLRAISVGPEDPDLADRLLAESNGILLWMLEGLFLLYTEGLDLPESLHRLKRTARGESSTWGLFVEDHIEWTDNPADYLNDEDIWLVWKDYVDEVLQGKFERPNKPVRVKDEFVHTVPQAWRRGRSRQGSPRSERNGFGGVRWTDEGRMRAQAAGVLEPPAHDMSTVTPLFGGGVAK